jgi:phenylpropionate dioxygenase-like ring-hydroxylating dioxygenase large terminal subunit
LDGKLIDRPDPEDWAECPLTEADTSLAEVKVGTWAGMVWVNMDPACEPLADYLAHLPEKLDPFELEACRFAAYWTIKVPANWKVVLEAFVEAYHVPGTHPQLLKFGHGHAPAAPEDLAQQRMHATHTTTGAHGPEPGSPYVGADPRTLFYARMEELSSTIRAMFLEPTMAAIERVRTEVPEGADATTVGERYFEFHKEEMIKSGAAWPSRLTRAELWSTEWQIFPNSSVLPTIDGALWYRARPDGDRADACIFDIWSLGRFPPGKAPSVAQEVFDRPEDFQGKSPFLEQDFKNLVAVQKGMKSRGWRGARPSPIQEVGVTNLHRVLHQYLYGDGPAEDGR